MHHQLGILNSFAAFALTGRGSASVRNESNPKVYRAYPLVHPTFAEEEAESIFVSRRRPLRNCRWHRGFQRFLSVVFRGTVAFQDWHTSRHTSFVRLLWDRHWDC